MVLLAESVWIRDDSGDSWFLLLISRSLMESMGE